MASVLIWAAMFYVLLQQARSQSCGTGSTACKCLWTDPKTLKPYTLDISNFFKYPYPAISNDGKYDFYYDPCKTQLCGITTQVQTNVCQKSTTSLTAQQYDCGINPVWNISSTSYFVIKYTAPTSGSGSGSVTRVTTVTFIGDSKSGNTATPVIEDPATKYSFTVHFPAASSSGRDVSGFVGFILISLIFVAFVAYFVAGAVIMYNKGARGIEMIPNIGFWKDLPFLIKDGFLFVLSPCCGKRFSYTKM